jgi:hypothetical protein
MAGRSGEVKREGGEIDEATLASQERLRLLSIKARASMMEDLAPIDDPINDDDHSITDSVGLVTPLPRFVCSVE